MTGTHEGPPLGSQARDTTAGEWHGKHRAPDPAWAGYRAAEAELTSWFGQDEPDDPPRCWSCGAPIDV